MSAGEPGAKIDDIAASLHRLEKAVLPHLEKTSSVSEIISNSGMQEVEVMRALHWLQNKGLVKLTEAIEEVVKPSKNAEPYAKKGLPETNFFNSLKGGPLTLSQIKKTTGLNDNEVGASIGILMRARAIETAPSNGEKEFKLTEKGKEFAAKGMPSQELFKVIRQNTLIKLASLSEEQKKIAAELKVRGVIEFDVIKNRTAVLTETGRQVLKLAGKSAETVDRLTPEMLKSGSWKEAEFRKYDLSAAPPRAFFGKLQPYREFLEEVREKFVSLGFEEMTGPIIESEFWNMDALFMPQFHSARDIHDAYYIKEPKFTANLPRELVKKVKAAHESGFGTGSRGWRYQFSSEKTSRLIMRSQTTACSSRKLASKDLKIPGKYFAIGRCFRYDVIDAKHLPDFNQVEGIVLEEGVNLRHMIGLLKMLAKEFCNTDQVKVVPSYFPFTEPSAALYAKHPQLGWMELGGSGVTRPEVTVPLIGRPVPNLTWGIGIDRIAMFKLGINDIRDLFSHDLNFLRSARTI